MALVMVRVLVSKVDVIWPSFEIAEPGAEKPWPWNVEVDEGRWPEAERRIAVSPSSRTVIKFSGCCD